MSNIFKASKTNNSVPPVTKTITRSNFFKPTSILNNFILYNYTIIKFNNSEFPELNDTTKEKDLIIHNGYMSAFQKEINIDNMKILESGYIMYTQGNNNEITIDYGDMKDRLNNECKNEYNFKLIANNEFTNIINKWEKYRKDYINLYEEETYNKLYKMKPSFYEDNYDYDSEDEINDDCNEDDDYYE